jgi:hypothetical protein
MSALPDRGYVLTEAEGRGTVWHEFLLLPALCQTGWICNMSEG